MVTTDRIDGLTVDVALKAPVKVATTAAITLFGEQTIDGVAITENDRVLVKDQTAGADNGIYVCKTTAWTRAKDWNGNRDVVQGTRVYIQQGSIYAGYQAQVTTSGTITIAPPRSPSRFPLLIDTDIAADLEVFTGIVAEYGNLTQIASDAAASEVAAAASARGGV
jgi:hypothetical protein